MSVKAQILEMVNDIPDTDLPVVLEVVRRFVPSDDELTLADIEAHNAAMEEYRAGETIPHDAIDWN